MRKRDSLVTDVITVEPPPTLHCSHVRVRLEKATIFRLIHQTQASPRSWGAGWRLLSESIPRVIITRWLANSGVSWAVQIMALANTIRYD